MNQRQGWIQLLTVGGFWLLSGSLVQSQVVPDDTLGGERSRLTPNVPIRGANGDLIEGGARRSGNLFHSFREFNVSEGQRLFFANPTGVQNILTRVTGTTGSNILGTLGVNGTANLFLLNPNGILFGPNAQLDVGGSFVGSTANAIRFGDQGEFRATNPNAPALLTVNPSALLFDRLNQGSIVNRSVTPLGTTPLGFNLVGLQVPQGKSFALVGGNVSFEGGGVNAPEGRIDIASVEGGGSIGLTQVGSQWNLSVPSDVRRADIAMSNATLNVVGANKGAIGLTAKNIDLSGETSLRAGIESGQGSVDAQAGDTVLDATDTIRAIGPVSIANAVRRDGIGNAGNIRLNTGSVFLSDDSNLITVLNGQGTAGDIDITARDAVTVSSGSSIDSSVEDIGTGKAGRITIRARSLSLSAAPDGIINGSGGRGDGGNTDIQVNSLVLDNSNIINSVQPGAIGQGGDIRIAASSISLNNESAIVSQSFGTGDAGNVFVNADNLSLTNQGLISTSSAGEGNAGNIFVSVRDRTSLDRSQIISTTGFPTAIGNGGSIFIDSGTLSLDNAALIGADIGAETRTGNGGDIRLTVDQALLLRRGSSITTSVGSAQGGGNGGNITIDADKGFLVSKLSENSDITANASGGRGGNVRINAEGIFGIQARPQQTDLSDITASSQTGIQGQIAINQPDVQPSQGTIVTANDVADTSDRIAQVCPRSTVARSVGEFTVTGRGSVPPSPIEPLAGTPEPTALATIGETRSSTRSHQTELQAVKAIHDSRNLAETTSQTPKGIRASSSAAGIAPPEMIEAQGWVKTANGNVALVAAASTTSPTARSTAGACPTAQ